LVSTVLNIQLILVCVTQWLYYKESIKN
jgi:hypothetical protein